MLNSFAFLEQIDFNRGAARPSGEDHNLSENAGASGRRSPPPFSHPAAQKVDFERAVLHSLGCPADLARKLEGHARKAHVGLLQTAIASGAFKASDVYDHLSRRLSFAGGSAPSRVRLPSAPDEAWRLLERPVPLAAQGEDVIALNGQTFPMHTLMALADKLGEKRKRLKLVTRQELIDLVTRSYGSVLVARAVGGLMKASPDWSAKTGLAAWQVYFGAIMGGLLLGALAFAPRETLTLAALGLSLFFLLAILLRLAAVFNLAFTHHSNDQTAPPLLSDAELPRYTVFVPLFKEVEILPHLARALRKLDYPPAKLDIKIVLESVDTATIEAASRLDFPGNVDLIVVPDRQPRTKPKALNYALQFATGDLAVIYDAEDRPEPDQLRKAATVFHHASAELACLQASLDYFNAKENWLSRQFTIEYATLFRGILPLLGRFGLPLPLGGTSNHFRIGVSRELGAWDPFNVTEDADLGMRLHRAGYRVETLDSTTYEEACCQTVPWIKQRTRWQKGWMQTFGVHMRKPLITLRETGLAGFLAFHAYFAGIIVSSLAHPVFYVVLASDAIQGMLFQPGPGLSDDILLGIALVNFVGGYAANLALGAMSLSGTRHKGLWPHVVFIPVYWLFVSAAAYRAVWQLIRAPFYWEKTEHGVSAHLKPAAA
jgi:cellulose synthase/poly-beta-1,6-N-acetylglucosamine synthase-like glycosyltransferase